MIILFFEVRNIIFLERIFFLLEVCKFKKKTFNLQNLIILLNTIITRNRKSESLKKKNKFLIHLNQIKFYIIKLEKLKYDFFFSKCD